MEEVPATECFLLLFGDVGARNRPEAGKTKCFVIFSKCFVVFSKCFVVFSKCFVVFTKSCVIFRSAEARIFLRRRMAIYSYYYGSEEADDFYLKLVNGGTKSTVTITLVPTGIEAVADKDALKADAVFDLSGRLLQRGGMQGLPAGIYIVKSGKQTRKVVIK